MPLLPLIPDRPRMSYWQTATLALWAAANCAWAQAPDGRVIQVQGDVRVGTAPVSAGMSLRAETLTTGADGRVQLRMSDGTLIALPPSSELRLPKTVERQLVLVSGGLRLSPSAAREGAIWRVDLQDRSIRTNGYLSLQACTSACEPRPGLYGRIAQGEAVLEYQGGRSVLRNRSFYWAHAGSRPEALAKQPAALDDNASQSAGVKARADVAATLQIALEAFRDNKDDVALAALAKVAEVAPGETLVPYYQGLIALRREDNASALRLLQEYTQVDPEGAASREVPKMLTLLSSSQLQQEVAKAVASEKDVVSAPPEPGSIAVQAFVNHGNDAYRAMAKGLAAMIIADLSKVPGLKVLEREKVQLLVNEAKLGDSGLADTASAVRSGRLMRAEKVVVGNFEVQ